MASDDIKVEFGAARNMARFDKDLRAMQLQDCIYTGTSKTHCMVHFLVLEKCEKV